jgi:DNA-binding LacI/PurR family transcriptional regulator
MAAQLDHLSTALLRKGLQCLLLNAADAGRDVAPLIAMMLEFRVRAIILMSGTPPGVIVNECLANGVPVIQINRPAKSGAGAIRSDDAAGAQLAADRLLRAGCRNIAVVGGDTTPSQVARTEAFVTYVESKGLKVLRSHEGPTGYDTGLLAAHRVLANKAIDGVFCVTDLLALGFLDGARLDMGRKVPNEISVIGFDDIPQAAWSSYRLTTIVQPLEELTTAVMAAIDRSDQSATVKAVSVIPVRLVERATVRG